MPYLKTIQHFKKKFKHKLENVCEKFNCRRPISYGSWLQFIVYFLGWIVFRKVYSYQVELALFLGLEIQCRSCHGIHRYGFWDGWVTLLFIVHILALRCIASWGVEFWPFRGSLNFLLHTNNKTSKFWGLPYQFKIWTGSRSCLFCFIGEGKLTWTNKQPCCDYQQDSHLPTVLPTLGNLFLSVVWARSYWIHWTVVLDLLHVHNGGMCDCVKC